ncbi:MAG: magnesium chelatase, partial [Ignavibacteriae bacterium HGW-Ignavibacteriae-3]
MFSKIFSGATFGIDAFLVEVETHSEKQIPSITIVGLPDNAVKESRERVTAAIKNSGVEIPHRKHTVNLAPADIKKEGSAFDLAIAIGLLSSNELVNQNLLNETILLGELSLDGSLRKIKGALPITVEARRLGIQKIILPVDSVKEASIVDGIEVYGLNSLSEVIQ